MKTAVRPPTLESVAPLPAARPPQRPGDPHPYPGHAQAEFYYSSIQEFEVNAPQNQKK